MRNVNGYIQLLFNHYFILIIIIITIIIISFNYFSLIFFILNSTNIQLLLCITSIKSTIYYKYFPTLLLLLLIFIALYYTNQLEMLALIFFNNKKKNNSNRSNKKSISSKIFHNYTIINSSLYFAKVISLCVHVLLSIFSWFFLFNFLTERWNQLYNIYCNLYSTLFLIKKFFSFFLKQLHVHTIKEHYSNNINNNKKKKSRTEKKSYFQKKGPQIIILIIIKKVMGPIYHASELQNFCSPKILLSGKMLKFILLLNIFYDDNVVVFAGLLICCFVFRALSPKCLADRGVRITTGKLVFGAKGLTVFFPSPAKSSGELEMRNGHASVSWAFVFGRGGGFHQPRIGAFPGGRKPARALRSQEQE
eukprot:gene6613-4733_t